MSLNYDKICQQILYSLLLRKWDLHPRTLRTGLWDQWDWLLLHSAILYGFKELLFCVANIQLLFWFEKHFWNFFIIGCKKFVFLSFLSLPRSWQVWSYYYLHLHHIVLGTVFRIVVYLYRLCYTVQSERDQSTAKHYVVPYMIHRNIGKENGLDILKHLLPEYTFVVLPTRSIYYRIHDSSFRRGSLLSGNVFLLTYLIHRSIFWSSYCEIT